MVTYILSLQLTGLNFTLDYNYGFDKFVLVEEWGEHYAWLK